mgnify:FL=1
MNSSIATLFATCLASVAILSTNTFAHAQDDHKFIGRSPDGQVAFEYVGKVKQNDGDFEAYGYFTYIRDLPDEFLFSPDPLDLWKRDETNARFLFYSKSQRTRFAQVGKVFNVGVAGTLQIYFRAKADEATDFAAGDHFKKGDQICTFALRGQSVIAVTSENVGVNSAAFEVEQQDEWKAFRFTDDGQLHALGARGALYRFSHFGRGDRSQAEPPIATISIAGQATTLGKND